jgi:hypothetical protein
MIAIAFRYVRRIAVDYRVAETVAWSKIIVDRSSDLMGVSSSMPARSRSTSSASRSGSASPRASSGTTSNAYPTFSSDIKHMFAHA